MEFSAIDERITVASAGIRGGYDSKSLGNRIVSYAIVTNEEIYLVRSYDTKHSLRCCEMQKGIGCKLKQFELKQSQTKREIRNSRKVTLGSRKLCDTSNEIKRGFVS